MHLRAFLLAATLAAAPLAATAGRCHTNDRWSGSDKDKHAAGGLVIGAAAGALFDSKAAGFLAGAAVGVAYELASAATGRGYCSLQDAAVTAAGAAVGAQFGPFLASVRRDGWAVTYRTAF